MKKFVIFMPKLSYKMGPLPSNMHIRNFFKNRSSIIYLVTDYRNYDSNQFLNVIENNLKAGVDVVQFRDKTSSEQEFIEIAKKIKALSCNYNIPFIINDRVDIAREVGADGVHVGQSDINPKNLRKIVGEDIIVGLSIENKEQVFKVNQGDVDYMGVGPIYNTRTKLDASPSIGIEKLKEIKKLTSIPIIAIGGITEKNISEIIETGINGAAMIGALMDHDNPEENIKNL